MLAQCCGCSIEKRRYSQGFHIERFHHHNNHNGGLAQTDLRKTKRKMVEQRAKCDSSIVVNGPEEIGMKEKKQENQQPTVRPGKKKLVDEPGSIKVYRTYAESRVIVEPRGGASYHPDAMASFLCGLAALACLFGIFLTGFSPVWLVAILIIALLVFAMLAKKTSKRAFDDMHYARDRYKGKGFAAAGFVMGMLSVVGLIGLALIIVFGIAFLTLT